eukprot:967905-Rhodomonas_salina.1
MSPSLLRKTARNLAPTALHMSHFRHSVSSTRSWSQSFETDSTVCSTSALLRRGMPFTVSDEAHMRPDAAIKHLQLAEAGGGDGDTAGLSRKQTAAAALPHGLSASDFASGYLNMTREQLMTLKPWRHL